MELRHLRCFVVCADVGSFSEAAEILYTTQPNVSKAIRLLENELGFPLFIRQRKGIQLTAKGRCVYSYASRALSNIDQMNSLLKEDMSEELLISSNPSSWMAACFAEFYSLHSEENIRFQMYSASVAEILVRISNYQDEIGFVYVMKSQNTSFQYALEKNHLAFVPLEETHAILYLGEKYFRNKDDNKDDNMEEIDIQKVCLVQNYADELNRSNYWRLVDENGVDLTGLHIKVVTNSDSVIEQLLETTKLANISSGYVTEEIGEGCFRGIPVSKQNNKILFGYIRRKETELSPWAGKYIEYVKQRIKQAQGDNITGWHGKKQKKE